MALVLRTRKAMEDVAKGSVLRSKADVAAADEHVKQQELILAGSSEPDNGTSIGVVAALVARHSLAAAASQARQLRQLAQVRTDQLTAELAETAKQRQVVEKLVDRQQAEWRRQEQTRDQKIIDELAVTARQRNEATGVGR